MKKKKTNACLHERKEVWGIKRSDLFVVHANDAKRFAIQWVRELSEK